jgi:hypothetical protein
MSLLYVDLGANEISGPEVSSDLSFGTGDFTLLLRVNPTVVNYGVSEQGTLVSRGFTAFEIFIYQGNLNGYVGGTSNAPGAIAISTSSWAAVGMRRSGTSLRLWKDNSFGTAATNSASANGSGDMLFGNRPGGSAATQTYSGLQRDFGLWNVALSDGEMSSYHAGYSARRLRPQSQVWIAPLTRLYSDIRTGRTISVGANGPAANASNPRVYS